MYFVFSINATQRVEIRVKEVKLLELYLTPKITFSNKYCKVYTGSRNFFLLIPALRTAAKSDKSKRTYMKENKNKN